MHAGQKGGVSWQDGDQLSLDIDPECWDDLKQRLEPVLEGLREGMTDVTARTMAAAAHAGLGPLGVQGTRVLLGLNLEQFCRDVVIRMVDMKKEHAVAKVEFAALESGAAKLVQQLSVALLCSGHVAHAAAVTIAFVEECEEAGMTAHTAASCIAPAVVAAVDNGNGHAVAKVQKIIVDHGHQDVVVWLTIYIAKDMGRPDVVAVGTLDAIEAVDGGMEMAAAVAAQAMMLGYHVEVAASAVLMDEMTSSSVTGKENSDTANMKVVEVVAAAALRGVLEGKPLDVVYVSHHMAARGGQRVVTRAMKLMAESGHAHAAGVISSTAIVSGFVALTLSLIVEVLRCGYIGAFLAIGMFCSLHLVSTAFFVVYDSVAQTWRRYPSVTSHPLRD